MRTKPLASALLKLGRAREHLSALDVALANFRESRPFHLVEEIDATTGEQLAYAVIDRAPPYHLALTLGDYVDNLRSALDHAIFGLSAVAVAPRELSEKEESLPGFRFASMPTNGQSSAVALAYFLPTSRISSDPNSHFWQATLAQFGSTRWQC